MNLHVWDFNHLWWFTFILLFQPLVTGSDTVGWDHMAGESASSTVLLLCRSFSSVECCLSVSEVTYWHPWWDETLLQTLSILCSQKCWHFNVDTLLCFYYLFWGIIIIIIRYVCLLSQAFLPGTSLEPAVIPTTQASSFTLQYVLYYVWCSKYSCLL